MKRERIEHENGVYVARREPRAEEVIGDNPAILVLFTHDFGKAAEVAWPEWSERWEFRRIGKPHRVWWRSVPGDPMGEGWAYHWHPAVPGTPGAIPAVLFEATTHTDNCLTPAGLEFEQRQRAEVDTHA